MIRKSGPRQVQLDEPPEDVLKTGGGPKVLLFQSKKLAFEEVVIGVENLGLIVRKHRPHGTHDVRNIAGCLHTRMVITG